MPIDVVDRPLISGAVGTKGNSELFEDFGRAVLGRELEEVHASINAAREALLRMFPGSKKIDLVLDIGFGPLRLSGETLLEKRERQPEKMQKLLSARIQQNLTHAIFFASSSAAPDQFAERIVKIYSNARQISDAYKYDIGAFFAGVRNESAIVKTLTDAGYTVALPDYTMGWDSEAELVENEVLQWDVSSGIDLVASKNGHAFLIDVKGPINGGPEAAIIKSPAYNIPGALRGFLYQQGITEAQRAEVRLPSRDNAYLHTGMTPSMGSYKQQLEGFIALKPRIAHDVSVQLSKPTKVAA